MKKAQARSAREFTVARLVREGLQRLETADAVADVDGDRVGLRLEK